MRIAILTANLGNFDKDVKDPVSQSFKDNNINGDIIEFLGFHRFTDEDFPPITGLTPRLQYRIPKLFGWEMFSGYDYYIWLDGGMSLQRADSVEWFLEQLADADMAFFRHPQRKTVKQEVEHIEDKLKQDHWYITPRYKNGLHREQLELMNADPDFEDNNLYASTAFIYKNNERARATLREWWFYQSRYYTCDQVSLPYAIHKSKAYVKKIPDNLFKIKYLSLVTHHK